MERTYLATRIQRNLVPAEMTSDGLLISKIACHDELALGMLYDRYCRLVYAIALRIAGDHQIAEEVTQDVFHAIWQSAGTFQPGSSCLSWLMGIARHRAIDATRSRRFRARQRELTLLDSQSSMLDSQTDRLLICETLRDALVTLPVEQRQPLALAFYGGLTHSEIADRLGEPIGTIKSRIRLGIVKLRSLLCQMNEYNL